ncbi:HAD-IA family hydrolase [Actinomyces sp. B33]|uniref:HAD-IA family hydrolase n=1 Tax=Actinomyces sp. B33 TaxID=2942131 RepID=UPI002341A282|nr:HAD-IA family hydrolase [Actinomyces sp. B33]MDC4232536.1 HAD-IA family hydrolase [Actinomyces sp. B33]
MADQDDIHAVLFDVGGVFISSHPDPRFVANVIGDGDDALVKLVDQAMWTHRDSYDAGCSDREFWDRVAGDCGKPELSDADIDRLVAHDAQRMTDADPDALALVDDLRTAGLRLGILSNAPRAVADAIRAAQWSDRFDFFVFSCDTGSCKPSRGIYREAVARSDENVANLLFVDDRKPNVRAGELMGLASLQWENPVQARRAMTDMGLLDR